MADIVFDPLINTTGMKELFLKVWNHPRTGHEAAAWLLWVTAPPAYQLNRLKEGEEDYVDIGMPPHATVAQVHTHHQKLSPLPSTKGKNHGRGDWDAAVKSGVPVYVLSMWAIWKIMPNNDQALIVQVANRWT
jgi:hypothetical protein